MHVLCYLLNTGLTVVRMSWRCKDVLEIFILWTTCSYASILGHTKRLIWARTMHAGVCSCVAAVACMHAYALLLVWPCAVLQAKGCLGPSDNLLITGKLL